MAEGLKLQLTGLDERIAQVLKKHPNEVNVRDLSDMVWALYGDEVNLKVMLDKKETEKVDENE